MAQLPSNPPAPTHVAAGEGQSHVIGPSKVTHKLDGAATSGRFAMIEYEVAPRFVAPTLWHWHTKEAFAGYVVAGKLSVAFPDRIIDVATGGVIAVPANCPFAWSNPSDEPAKVLFIYGPAGFEDYFRDVSSVLAKNPGVPTKDLGPQLAPLWQEYGLESEG